MGHMNHEVLAAEVRRVRLATPHINADLEAPGLYSRGQKMKFSLLRVEGSTSRKRKKKQSKTQDWTNLM